MMSGRPAAILCNTFFGANRGSLALPVKSRIEGLSDDHEPKPSCLFDLALLFREVGNWVECKRLLTDTSKLWRERGSDLHVAQALRFLADVNRLVELYGEGTQQAEEALRIYEKLGDTLMQAECLNTLGSSFFSKNQLDAAEEAVSRVTNYLANTGGRFRLCESHNILGDIYSSKGETEKAISHREVALRIASPFSWHDILFWLHYGLAALSRNGGGLEDTQSHIERIKPHVIDSTYNLGRVMIDEPAG